LYDIYQQNIKDTEYNIVEKLKFGMYSMFGIEDGDGCSLVYPKQKSVNIAKLESIIENGVDDIYGIISDKHATRDSTLQSLIDKFRSMKFPEIRGDEIIQIGVTVHTYGSDECSEKHILTLGTCDDIDNVRVQVFEREQDLLMAFRKLITDDVDPDVITGYNINGFDFSYVYHRCTELGIWDEFSELGRLKDKRCKYVEQKLSSSALGDNLLKYIDMPGRIVIDIMKVVQREHKLDSYKLDNVAAHFLKANKNDVSPQDIFRLQKGSSADRKTIAEYCVQDCALCNRLVINLELMANNIGMSNVCLVPLNYIFTRGQGIKIFSLVMNECKEAGFLIPVIKAKCDMTQGDSYEGAIVLDPVPGIYIEEPVSVLDYASLYPSSMISENLSHDSIVLDPRYDNLPGVDYLNISYDIYDEEKNKIGERVCRYFQPKDEEKSLIPKILMKLLQARKSTRKRITMKHLREDTSVRGWYDESKHKFVKEDGSVLLNIMCDDVEDVFNVFQKAVLDGLQNAYKITANSLYGQCGARTSQIYMKDIAACTTATGRRMIMLGKEFLETKYNAKVVYGDTDSLFVIFNNVDPGLTRKGLIMPSIEVARKASKEFGKTIKHPHDLEYEKTFWPFILLSKKRYVGNKYEDNDIKYKQNSMGIVLKRRDNAPIVKKIYGGLIDIILDKQDINTAVCFLKSELLKMESNQVNIEELVITKNLRGEYKDPTKIAHKVLADRMALREPGNKPQVNDRIPYVYIVKKGGHKKNVLQGERIEHVDYVMKNKIKPDVQFYITNQVMNPVCQLLSIVVEQIPGFSKLRRDYAKEYLKLCKTSCGRITHEQKIIAMKEADVEKMLFTPVVTRLSNKTNGIREITDWFSPI
jgi:DNA polymerase delta subunit 1